LPDLLFYQVTAIAPCRELRLVRDLAAPCLPARKSCRSRWFPKHRTKPACRRALKIELATAKVPLAADELYFLFEIRIANPKGPRDLAFHRGAWNGPVAKQPIYVQLEAGFEAGALTVS
jgi:hypothetical protein